jgi:hypothetical protein
VCSDCKAANFKEYYHNPASFKCTQNKTVKVYSCISDRSSWYLDSGCSQHMSGAQLPSTNNRPSSVSITTASGHLQSTGIGTVKLGHLAIKMIHSKLLNFTLIGTKPKSLCQDWRFNGIYYKNN